MSRKLFAGLMGAAAIIGVGVVGCASSSAKIPTPPDPQPIVDIFTEDLTIKSPASTGVPCEDPIISSWFCSSRNSD